MSQFQPRGPLTYSYEGYYVLLEPTLILGGNPLYLVDKDTVLDIPIAVFRLDDDVVLP